MPWTNAVDFRSTLLPNNQFTRIYAPGSRQNHPKQPGLYRFFLARGWKSGDHPDGEYRLDVEAWAYNVLDQNAFQFDVNYDLAPINETQPLPALGRSFFTHVRFRF